MKILVAVFAYNEGEKIITGISRHPKKRNYDLLLMDDGSTDGSIEKINDKSLLILRHSKRQGIGRSIKDVLNYSLKKKYKILVIQGGNNKDDPNEIPRLIEPIIDGRADFVQGSRFMTGAHYSNTPLYRIIAIKYIHPILFSIAVRKRLTETTNGFRAIKVSILLDKRIHWNQKWLDSYELEPYLLFKTIKLGYRHMEVPVTKIYPQKALGYTKMKPITGWWSILRPVIFLWLGIKK